MIVEHPVISRLGIDLGITFAIESTITMFNTQRAFALMVNIHKCTGHIDNLSAQVGCRT
jgi:hypothetical protein